MWFRLALLKTNLRHYTNKPQAKPDLLSLLNIEKDPKIPKINSPDCFDIEKWKNHPNVKINENNEMEVKDPLDPLYKRLPSYRTDLSMTLQGRHMYERERVLGMTEAERKWRLQWQKDQELKDFEPVMVPELHKFYTNIFRRIYKFPLNLLAASIAPIVGVTVAQNIRMIVSATLHVYFGILLMVYMLSHGHWFWDDGLLGFDVVMGQKNRYEVEDITDPEPIYDMQKFGDFGFHKRTFRPNEEL